MNYRTLIILILFCGFAGAVHGQEARNGTNAAAQLLAPVDAHYLGGSGAASMASGIEGVLWNPAGVDRGSGNVLLMTSRHNFIADVGINFAGLGYRFGNLGAVAVHLRSFDINPIEKTSEFYMDGTGETFKPTFFTIGGTYSRAMTDRINIGVTTNLVYEGFANVSGSSVTFDAGVQYRQFLGLSGLNVGVAIRNIGTSMQYDGSALFRQTTDQEANRSSTQYKVVAADADMPTVMDIGVGYELYPGLQASVNYIENTYAPGEVRGLLEYDIVGYVHVRGAYTMPTTQESELENIYEGFALGGSINLQQVLGSDIALDYGYMPVKFFQANHIFTLRGSL